MVTKTFPCLIKILIHFIQKRHANVSQKKMSSTVHLLRVVSYMCCLFFWTEQILYGRNSWGLVSSAWPGNYTQVSRLVSQAPSYQPNGFVSYQYEYQGFLHCADLVSVSFVETNELTPQGRFREFQKVETKAGQFDDCSYCVPLTSSSLVLTLLHFLPVIRINPSDIRDHWQVQETYVPQHTAEAMWMWNDINFIQVCDIILNYIVT